MPGRMRRASREHHAVDSVRHDQIGEQQINALFAAHDFDRFAGIFRGHGNVTDRLQHRLRNVRHFHPIVDHQ